MVCNTRVRMYRKHKRGKHFLEYYVQEKRFQKSLTDENGVPVTIRIIAETGRDRELIFFAVPHIKRHQKKSVTVIQPETLKENQCSNSGTCRTPVVQMWENNPWRINIRGNFERELSPTSVKDNESQWNKFLAWTYEHNIVFAEDVSVKDAQNFQNQLLADKLSGNRVNKIIGCCSVMYDLSRIRHNPFKSLRKRYHKSQGRRELTVEELTKVCNTATGELRILLALGLYTGLRLGDASCLQWENFNPVLEQLVVETSKAQYSSHSEVVIPVHPVLKTMLESQPKSTRYGYVLPTIAEKYKCRKTVLSKEIQKHFTNQGIELYKAGTGPRTGKRAVVKVGFHSLRHSFISICAREGVPLHTVQSLCAHSSLQVQKLYLHNNMKDSEKAVFSLPDITAESEKCAEDKNIRKQAEQLIKTASIDKIKEFLAICRSGEN